MKRLGHLQSSIKEAVDNLPSGVCFFDKNGFVVLCNRTMYRLAFAITGRDLQTFSELENALRNLPDGTAWRFSSEVITDESGARYTQVVASEVSDLYQGSRELAENIAKLKEFQAYIHSTIKNVAVITRENEILSLKMRIHDELGGSLLKLRRYHLHTDGESKSELLANWKKTVSMLKFKSGPDDVGDPLADLLRSAASIGVEIIHMGKMPENTAAARLIVYAIRECLTNAVRHAGGSRIFVVLTQTGDIVSAVITNDGEPPKAEIIEGGGLSSLRKRIEKAGGTMTVQSLPRFSLSVAVPLEQFAVVAH